MDGEPGQNDDAAVDEHVAGCADCATWQHRAGRISRSIRVRPASPTPDFTSAILAAADTAGPADQDSRERPAPSAADGEKWRWLLGLIALVQLSLGLAQFLGVSDMGHMVAADSEHLFNESTAWNIALGMGFVGAAVWPKLAGGLLPTLGVFVAVLTVVSVIDLVNGEVEVSRVASHLVVVVGMAVLLVVHRQFVSRPGPVKAQPEDSRHWAGEPMPDRRSDGAARGRGGLRPAGRHAA